MNLEFFYWLGTNGKTKRWVNPAILGHVIATSSGVMHDSEDEKAIVGRTVCRCVTQPQEGAWMAVELKSYQVKPTHYTLRHYDTWDTECARSWNFEGSNGNNEWECLRAHHNDTHLESKGQSYTWEVDVSHFYHIFRIKITGPNSNKHNYLALSGFELYGTLKKKIVKEEKKRMSNNLPSPSQFLFKGLIYKLGCWGETKQWENPAEAGIIDITSSSLLHDSSPRVALAGRDLVRCVTKPQPNSWFCFDFKDKLAKVEKYALRHYSTWDTEAIRNWRFEASNDTSQWDKLTEHFNDDTLQEKGATASWRVSNCPKKYRYFRILQTAQNSNKHHYLALSGVEFYGQLYNYNGTRLNFDSIPISPPSKGRTFTYIHDFDQEGILYWIATKEKTTPWRNPAEMNLVMLATSGLSPDSEPISSIVGNKVVRCVTTPEKKSWFLIDLLNYVVKPTHYTLRHYSTWDTEAIRNWRFQGSMDNNKWTTLMHHNEDDALKQKGATHTWKIPNNTGRYRTFRILQTGANSNQHQYLALSGFELYGNLYSLDEAMDVDMVDMERKLPLEINPSVMIHDNLSWAVSQSKSLAIKDRDPSMVKNTGSSDKWQMVRSLQPFKKGKHHCAIKIITDPRTSNTWRFIIGVVPGSLDCTNVKQWVGTGGSWGYIAGSGGKCQNSPRCIPYGETYGLGDVIGIYIDLDEGTIEFLKNGKEQGIAFKDVKGPVHVAASMTATDAVLAFVSPYTAQGAKLDLDSWDINNKSSMLSVNERGDLVTNTGSDDKWQSIRSVKCFRPSDRVCKFEVELLEAPPTPNSWKIIVGVVPASFTCIGSKQWVGAGESFGYIGGMGGICYNKPQSAPYGEKYGKSGDIITVVLDFPSRTIEFYKNGTSQGIAFRNLKGECYAAVSLTASGASARLKVLT